MLINSLNFLKHRIKKISKYLLMFYKKIAILIIFTINCYHKDSNNFVIQKIIVIFNSIYDYNYTIIFNYTIHYIFYKKKF